MAYVTGTVIDHPQIFRPHNGNLDDIIFCIEPSPDLCRGQIKMAPYVQRNDDVAQGVLCIRHG